MADTRLGWTPWGTCRVDGVPERGALLADEHVVWEVIEIGRLDHDPDSPGSRTHELTLVSRTGPVTRRRVQTSRFSAWWTYLCRRFPVCSCCGEPAPCRAQVVEDTARRAVQGMARFATAHRCPACLEEVMATQASATFPDNLRVPLGPPVTFHLDRPVCQAAAAVYEHEWRDAGASRTG